MKYDIVSTRPKIVINISNIDQYEGRIKFISLDLDYYGKNYVRMFISHNKEDNTYELKPLFNPRLIIKSFVSERDIKNRYIYKWIGENAEEIIETYF